MLYFSIIGVPKQGEWPVSSSIPWVNFKDFLGINMRHLIGNISGDGLDLIKVLLRFYY